MILINNNDGGITINTQTLLNSSETPFRALNTISPSLDIKKGKGQELMLSSLVDPGECKKSIVEYLRTWALIRPDTLMIASRSSDGCWHGLTYSEAKKSVDSVAQSLLNFGLSEGDKILILSENSVEHAVLMLAAMTIGVAVVPVSVGYSFAKSDNWSKLKRVYDLTQPAMVFAQKFDEYSGAIDSLRADSENRFLTVAVEMHKPDESVIAFQSLLESEPRDDVDSAYLKTGLDTVAKIIFTSGSTGIPKGVITTQRMLCKNMAMQDAFWTNGENELPYVTLCWMPWSHSMAGNGLLNRSLRQGGSYYIDNGKPIGKEFEKTINNLKDISPHSYSDVPAGFSMLADALEADAQLNNKFFKKLRFLQYAGASLPDELWKRLQQLAIAATGKRIPFLTGYGCTEAGPLITQLYWPIEGSGVIGLPAPGVKVKLVPVTDGRYEIRVKGENITPGYILNRDATAAAFDSDGFYITGDSIRFVDPQAPEKGMRFSSRIVEDFKLQTGTFVQVGLIRTRLLDALMPWFNDFVITGENRSYLGAMGWLNTSACKKLIDKDLPDASMISQAVVISTIKSALQAYNRLQAGSASQVKRLMLLEEPPSAAENEITEKGYINQRRVLERRSSCVDQLYSSETVSNNIIYVDE